MIGIKQFRLAPAHPRVANLIVRRQAFTWRT